MIAVAEDGHRSVVEIDITPAHALSAVVVGIADDFATTHARVGDGRNERAVAGFFDSVVAALVDGVVSALFNVAHDDLALFGRPELLVVLVAFVTLRQCC